MHVTVHYLAQLRRAAGVDSERIEVAPTCTLMALLAALAEKHGETFRTLLLEAHDRPRPSLLVFVGEEQVRVTEDRLLHDGDVVTILTPMAGG